MFNRKQYKSFAKKQLKGRWGIPVICTIIILAVEFIFQLPSIIKTAQSEELWYILNQSTITIDDIESIQILLNNSTSLLVTIIQSLVSVIFEVAALNVILKMSLSPEPITFSLFLTGLNNWARACFAFLWRTLWLFLWTILTFPLLGIPAIIKTISYSQLMYLIAEHKELSIPKALKISMVITKGHKWELFVMDLSFLGWIILASIPAGLGFIVLQPYMNMSYVNAYHSMLQEALDSGIIKPEDLTE